MRLAEVSMLGSSATKPNNKTLFMGPQAGLGTEHLVLQ